MTRSAAVLVVLYLRRRRRRRSCSLRFVLVAALEVLDDALVFKHATSCPTPRLTA
jgi:hypothetical protein